MKISINARIVDGPWGGGNQAVASIAAYLRARGHAVLFDLNSENIDLIVMIHPDRNLRVISYGIEKIIDYLKFHPNTILVHRVNTSSERKGCGSETETTTESNKYADYTVFISEYLKVHYEQHGFDRNKPYAVVLNGADEEIFNPKGGNEWMPGNKMKIVTHHWSDNYMKGFDVYERLDQLLGTKPYSDLFEFCVIGNVPKGLVFKNTRVISPMHNNVLAEELKKNHIYLTATRNEPAGMHHIEGMMCGLPVIYLKSGALPEYCLPFGVEFTLIDFEKQLLEMPRRYADLRRKVLDCPYTASRMGEKYCEIFEELAERRRRDPKPMPGAALILKRYFYDGPVTMISGVKDGLSKLRRRLF